MISKVLKKKISKVREILLATYGKTVLTLTPIRSLQMFQCYVKTENPQWIWPSEMLPRPVAFKKYDMIKIHKGYKNVNAFISMVNVKA